jgi:upstream activation factor subunit UAF30
VRYRAGDSRDGGPKNGKGTSGRRQEGRRAGQGEFGLHEAAPASEALSAVIGSSPLPRSEAVSKMWDYIRKHNLQNPENKREIIADAALKPVFGKDKVTMFEMNKHLAQHLK